MTSCCRMDSTWIAANSAGEEESSAREEGHSSQGHAGKEGPWWW